jgi:lipopolysaccharide export LptBFGC system permease protein LptF
MLIGLAFGATPSSFTVPFTVAAEVVPVLATVTGLPALTTCRLQAQTIPAKAINKIRRFVVIQTNFLAPVMGT